MSGSRLEKEGRKDEVSSDQKWPKSPADFSMKLGGWLKGGAVSNKPQFNWMYFPPKAFVGHMCSCDTYIHSHTHKQTLAPPSFIGLIVFSPLVCSWEVTKMRHGFKLFQNPVTHIRLLGPVILCVCVCYISVFMCAVRQAVHAYGPVYVTQSICEGHYAQCSGKDVKNTWLWCATILTGAQLWWEFNWLPSC